MAQANANFNPTAGAPGGSAGTQKSTKISLKEFLSRLFKHFRFKSLFSSKEERIRTDPATYKHWLEFEHAPDIKLLSEEGLLQLYMLISDGLRNCGLDTKFPEKLKVFFGKESEKTPFYRFVPNNKAKIGEFMNILEKNSSNSVIISNIKRTLFSEAGYSLKNFNDDYIAGNFSKRFIGKLKEVITSIQDIVLTSNREFLEDDPIYNKLINDKNFDILLDSILNELYHENIPSIKLDLFRTHHQEILEILYRSDKFTKEVFPGTKIAELVESIKTSEEFKYENITPISGARDRGPTRWENFSGRVKDFAKGDTNPFAMDGANASRVTTQNYAYDDSRTIASAIRETKLGPTSGLSAIIAANINLSGSAKEAWSEGVKILSEVKGEMDRKFNDAPKKGEALNAVIGRFIELGAERAERITDLEKKEKFMRDLKVTMEVIAAFRPTPTTAKTWSAYKAVKPDIFKDSKKMNDEGLLKWFAIGANWLLDRAKNVIYKAIVISKNLWDQRGVRFKGKQKKAAKSKSVRQAPVASTPPQQGQADGARAQTASIQPTEIDLSHIEHNGSNLQNPYEILGVPESVSDAEIKFVYRNLMKQYHPDKNPSNKEAEEKFIEINSAYDAIKKNRKMTMDEPKSKDIPNTQQGQGDIVLELQNFWDKTTQAAHWAPFGIGKKKAEEEHRNNILNTFRDAAAYASAKRQNAA